MHYDTEYPWFDWNFCGQEMHGNIYPLRIAYNFVSNPKEIELKQHKSGVWSVKLQT